jgi:hypothetical protein
MPAAIPYIVYAIGTYIGVNAAVVVVAVLVASALVSNYQKRKAARAARDAYNASLEDRTTMTATANEPRSWVYGLVRNVDGIVFKGTHGPNKEKFTLVVSMAGHEIDSFRTIYFNDIPVSLSPDGIPVTGGAEGGQGYNVTTEPYAKTPVVSASADMTVSAGVGSVVLPFTPIAGSVSASIHINPGSEEFDYEVTPTVVGDTVSVSGVPYNGTWKVQYQYTSLVPKAKIWMYRGVPGQTLYPLLSTRFPGLLTASDKFSGMAIVVAELTYDQDVYPSGVPNISAVMRGAKILDTRTGITAFSENPAMIARAWALNPYGGGCATSDINEEAFQAAANACDTSTVFNTTSGNETRPLYQCGIVCKTDVNPDDHFGEMIESMAGEWGFAGGQIKVIAGVARAPVAAIDPTWLTNKLSVNVVKDPSKQNLVNNFKPVIANADGYIDGITGPITSVAYTSTPMPNVRSQTYIDADGEELTRETVMLGVTRNVHAQHICSVQMRNMRDGMLVQLSANMKAWPLELFDVVTLTLPTFGFNAKQFMVMGWRYTLEDGVSLTLKETSPAIYTVNGGMDVLDLAQNTTLPLPWVVEQVTGVTVTSGTVALEDGWPTTRTEVTWNAVVDESVRQSGSIEIQYTQAVATLPAGDWPAVYEQGNSTKTVITGLLANTAYVFRVRAKNTLGVAGKWATQKNHIITQPPLVDTPIIEDEAATVALAVRNASGTTNAPTVIATASWTNDGNIPVEVQCDYALTINTNSGTDFVNFSSNINGSSPILKSSPNVSTTPTLVAYMELRTVQPAETINVYLEKFAATGAVSLTWSNAIVRLTAVKR